MNTIFSLTGYVLKRQGLSIAGKYRLFGLDNDIPLLFIEEQLKWIPLMTIVHVYADEKKKQELLKLQTSKIDHVEMDVIDAESGQKIGGIGMAVDDLSEIIKDAWTITDADDKPIGKAFERSTGQAVLREVLDHALPQKLDITVGETLAGELRQKSKMIGYELTIDFSMDTTRLLDRRLGLASAIFIARHQGIEE
jgi:hypothetical protein